MYRAHTHLNECARIPIFSSLKKNQLARLAAAAFERTFTGGIVVYRHGTSSSSVCAVTDGSLEKYIDIGDISVAIGSVQRFSAWGLETVARPRLRFHYSVRSGPDGACLLEWHIQDLLRLFAGDPDVHTRLLTALAVQQEHTIRSLEESLALALAIQPIIDSPDMPLHEKYEMLLAFTAEVCHATCGCLVRFEPNQNLIRVEAALGYREITQGSAFSLQGDTLLSRIYTSARAMHISPASYERQYMSARYSRQHMALVPLNLTDDATGALMLADDTKPMGSDVVALMQVVALGIRFLSLTNQEARSKTYAEYVNRVYVGLL